MKAQRKSPITRRSFLKLVGATSAAIALPFAQRIGYTKAQAEPVRLTFWHSWPADPFNSIIAAMVEKFNSENPDIIVEATGFQNEDYKLTILNTAFAGGEPPDIFSSVGFEWLFTFVREGQVLDLTDYYTANLAERYVPGIETAYKYDNKFWAVPWRIGGTPFMYFNTGIFEQLGLTADDISTMDGLMAACDASLAANITPIAFANKGQWNAVHWVANFIKNLLGAERAAAVFTGQAGSWTDPEVVEGITLLKTFMDRGYFGANTANEDFGVVFEQFLAGQTAMQGTGGWVVSGVVDRMKEDESFRADFIEFPMQTGKSGLGSDWVFWGETWAASSGGEEAAKIRFLDALGSLEYQALCYEMSPDTYAVRGASENSTIELDPLLAKKFELYESTSALVPIPDVAVPTQATTVMYEELQGVLLGQVSPEDAAQNIADAIARALPS